MTLLLRVSTIALSSLTSKNENFQIPHMFFKFRASLNQDQKTGFLAYHWVVRVSHSSLSYKSSLIHEGCKIDLPADTSYSLLVDSQSLLLMPQGIALWCAYLREAQI